jgi:two-component system, OmpR family, response regulator ResD
MASILIIEDYPSIQQIYNNVLTHAGYKTHTASSGKAALDLAKTHQFDLILLDLLLPDVDGLELLGKLRRPGCKIIVVSNMDTPALRSQAQSLGADGYLLKASITPQELGQQVQDILSKPN